MFSIVAYGPRDLRLEETESPAAPGPGDVLVDLQAGGICGSDLHYFNHGGFGTVRLKEPLILGHEVAGTVAALGEGVDGLAVGQTVAVNPSAPCGRLRPALNGHSQFALFRAAPSHCRHSVECSRLHRAVSSHVPDLRPRQINR